MIHDSNKPIATPTVIHQPNPDLIKHCEHLLDMAKKGEMRSIMEVCEWNDGRVSSGMALHAYAEQSRMMAEMFTIMTTIAFTRTSHADELYGCDPGDPA